MGRKKGVEGGGSDSHVPRLDRGSYADLKAPVFLRLPWREPGLGLRPASGLRKKLGRGVG